MSRKRIGGVPKLVRVISSDELAENGGQFILSGKVAVPVIVDETVTRVIGGPISDRVYIVSQDEIDSGSFKVLGGSAVPVADSAIVTPARLESSGRAVMPIFIISGTLGGPEGAYDDWVVDEFDVIIFFANGQAYVYDAVENVLTRVDAADIDPDLDVIHILNGGVNKKLKPKDFRDGVGAEKVHFRVTKTADQANAHGVWTEITWETANRDTHSGMDLANNRYIIPTGQGGLWLLYGALWMNERQDAGRIGFRINGEGQARTEAWIGGDPSTDHLQHSNNGTTILNLSEGDYVKLWGYKLTAGFWDENVSYTGFWGCRIG